MAYFKQYSQGQLVLDSLHSQFHVYLSRQLTHWEKILASVPVFRGEFWELSGYLATGASA